MTDADVVVVGGGPAGDAAAMCCARLGLRTVLVERERFPRDRPGESLHAIAERTFEHLGVRERVLAECTVRSAGAWIGWGGPATFRPYDGLGTGASYGFQAPGDVLDAILLDRVREAGVDVRQPCDAIGPLMAEGRMCGISSTEGDIRARWVIDAGGRRHWLARRIEVPIDRTSPQLLAHFGYATGSCPARDDAPFFQADVDGWTWRARVGAHRYHWTRLSWRRGPDPRPPAEFAPLTPTGPTRAIDVTWRRVRAPSGPGYWCAGDAAAVVDPAGSHGVIRALTAGILIAELCGAIAGNAAPEEAARSRYDSW
ncbi:MAG TPA: tryptophan 7-halogenase, partial [Gemmatimonadaceae bacterium]|nr:tryptophan 7-halogenase [Gemmatimonadaceae bacterium]